MSLAESLFYLFKAVSREIRKILTERAANFNIALDDVSITSLTFGKEFTAAIEAKQVAAQEAERAKFVVEKAEQDKKSAVIRAQVSAEKCSKVYIVKHLRTRKMFLFDDELGGLDCPQVSKRKGGFSGLSALFLS